MSTQQFQIFFFGNEYTFNVFQLVEDSAFGNANEWICEMDFFSRFSSSDSYKGIISEMYELAKLVHSEYPELSEEPEEISIDW